MFAVGMLGSYITQGVYTVAGPFHPFGGAVDIIVVQQDDGTFKSSPWNVKFGKFQGVLKTKEKIVGISVNDVPMDFHMYLDHKGEAYFEKEVEFGEEMLLSPISPTSSGDEMSEFGKRKVLSLQIAKAEDGKMQETTNTGMDTKTSRISNDGDNLNSEMPDHVDSNSTVWISDALVDEDRNEVVIAISESNSYLIEGNLGTVNGSQAILRKEEHAPERLEKSISKPPSSVYGLVFGGKSQHLLGGSSSPINSRERAEIVVDLLDKRWRTSGKEILFTSTNNLQAVSTTTSLGTEVKDTGSLMHDSEGSTSVRNEAPFWKSVSQDTAGAGLIAEDLEQPMSDEANSENARSGEMQTNTLTLEVSAKNRANSVEHVPSEDWFLRSAAEEQTLVLLFQGRLGEAASSNDHNSGDQNGKCNAGQAASDEVAPIGVLVEDVNENPKCGPVPEVVLMSVDGHIITAPVNVEGSHHGEYFDISENSSGGNRDVQVAVSSIAKCELLNPGKESRSEEFSLVPCSSTISMPAVSVDHGTNELSEMTTEFVSIEEVPALSSEGKIDKCGDTKPVSDFETSEYVRARAQIFSPEMTSDIISSEKIEECTDKEVGSVQNTQLKPERFVVNDMQAADERRRQQAHSSDVTIIPDCTTGESDMILKSEPCLDLGASATPAHYVLDDDSIGTEDLHASRVMEFRNVPPRTCHDWVPLNLHVDGKQLSHIYLSSQSGRVSPKVIDSPSQQGCERFYSFKEGSNVDLEAENSEEDLFKSCLALEELPNRAENDPAEALLEVCDSGFEVVHAGNSLLSSDSVDSYICKQPSVKANSKKFMRIRSKPILVPQGENEKSLDLMSSASLPARFYEAERSNKGHFVGHLVGSGSLPAISQSHLETDATGFQGQDLNFADRRQILESVIYGSQKDSAEIVEVEDGGKSSSVDVDLSLCRHLLSEGIGAEAAAVAFESHKVSYEAFQRSGSAIVADDKLVVKIGGRYFTWVEAAPYIVGMVAFGSEFTYKLEGGIAIEAVGSTEDVESQTVDTVPSSTRWNLWPFSFRRSSVEKGSRLASPASKQASSAATNIALKSPFTKEPSQKNGYYESPQKSKERTYVPTSAQLASLKLKDGPNKVTFTFSTRVLGKTQVDARIYLWKWNTRIVVSDVDGTITKSDVLGQVMPLVGRDWSQSGVTRLFSAIKDNGYELLFLSARAISQAYLTRQFLLNLKQDGETLPDGPVFISPDGLIPSLYREVIRRAPHEFKISCLEGIRELFPRDVNPFYAGFGNRNTDEISYLKVGIPKGKIFIINPKGEVVVNHRVEDVKSYTSLHKLVDDMFPAMSSHEQEDFNSWNYWKLPLPDIEDEFKRMEKKGGD